MEAFVADRETARARAQRSGFPPKLRAWVDANREDAREGREVRGPVSASQVAKMLTHHGEFTIPNTVERWMRADALPLAKHIALLEKWMAVPWAYLDNPSYPWPPARNPDYWESMLSSLRAEERKSLQIALERFQKRRETRG